MVKSTFHEIGVSWVRIPLGAFDFSGNCSVHIDRHIRVDLSDDEHCSKYAMLVTYTLCSIMKKSNTDSADTDIGHCIYSMFILCNPCAHAELRYATHYLFCAVYNNPSYSRILFGSRL